MSQSTDSLPYEPPPTDPADPRYEGHRAMLRESELNFEYYIEHEAEMFDQHPDEIAIVYDGGKVQYCSDEAAVEDFLDRLDNHQRSAALLCTALLSQGAWAL